jgi:hypothetical protein
MVEKPYRYGYLCFGLGFFFSGIVSLRDRIAGAGPAGDFVRGALGGLSVLPSASPLSPLLSQCAEGSET